MTPFAATDWTAHHAVHRPNGLALRSADDQRQLSWSELDGRVGRLARVLADHGVRKGDRVALIAENDPKVFETQFAAMRLGALLVPLNWRLSTAELVELTADAEPAILIHDDQWAGAAATVAGAIPRLEWSSGASNDYDQAIGAASYREPGNDVLLDDPTHILYTSGTTGKPKGVLSTNATLVWQALNTAHSSRYAEPGNHQLNQMPLFHAGGLNVMANPILYFGGSVSTLRRFAPEAVLAALADTSLSVPFTHFAAIPLMYRAISALPEFDDVDLSHLRQLIVAGAIAEPELLQRWAQRGVPLQPQYGGSEHGPMATALDDPEQWLDKACRGTTGRRARHTEIRLTNTAGDEVPTGETGEIWLRGPSVTVGYWRDAGRDAFVDGWYRTGDAASRDEDGFYYLTGRIKEMYKSGGENVYPAEVERVLGSHPNVAEITVIGVDDPQWGEVGLAVVVSRGEAVPTLEELNEFARDRLARYKLPKSLVIVEHLPRNVTGKVSRADLKARYGGR